MIMFCPRFVAVVVLSIFHQEQTFCGIDLELFGLDDSEYVPTRTSTKSVEILPGLEGDDIYPGLSASVNQWLGREDEAEAVEDDNEEESDEREDAAEEEPAAEEPVMEEEPAAEEEPAKDEEPPMEKPAPLKKYASTLDTKNSTSRFVPAQKPKRKLFRMFGKKNVTK
jgi:hypothetical protein